MLVSLCWSHYVGLIMLVSLCWSHYVGLIMLVSVAIKNCYRAKPVKV